MREFSGTTLPKRALAVNNEDMSGVKRCNYYRIVRKRQNSVSVTPVLSAVQRIICKNTAPFKTSIISHSFVDARKGCVDFAYREKIDPLGSTSYLPPSHSVEFLIIKLLAPWRSMTFVCPRCSHNLVPSDFDGSPYQPGAINRKTYGVTNRLASLENYVHLLRVPKTLQPLLPLPRLNEPIQYATRAVLPETGSRVGDLYNRQDQTPESASNSFE